MSTYNIHNSSYRSFPPNIIYGTLIAKNPTATSRSAEDTAWWQEHLDGGAEAGDKLVFDEALARECAGYANCNAIDDARIEHLTEVVGGLTQGRPIFCLLCRLSYLLVRSSAVSSYI